MLNEILNKREDREVWRIKEQIEIGKLKRAMPGRLGFVGGVLFTSEARRGGGAGPCKGPFSPGVGIAARPTHVSTTLHSPSGSLAHFRLEGNNEITKKEKKNILKSPTTTTNPERKNLTKVIVHT